MTGWDATSGKKLGELREPVPVLGRFEDRRAYAAAVNNSEVVLATTDGKLWAANYEKGTRAETLGELNRPLRFTCPTFSANGKLLAVGLPVEKGLEFGVRVYSWPGGEALHTFTGHRGPVTATAFSPGRSGARLRVARHHRFVVGLDRRRKEVVRIRNAAIS